MNIEKRTHEGRKKDEERQIKYREVEDGRRKENERKEGRGERKREKSEKRRRIFLKPIFVDSVKLIWRELIKAIASPNRTPNIELKFSV